QGKPVEQPVGETEHPRLESMDELLGQRHFADLPGCHANGEQYARSDLAKRHESNERQRARRLSSRCCFAVSVPVRGGVLQVQTTSIESDQSKTSEPCTFGCAF